MYVRDDGITTITVAGEGRGPYCAAEVIAHEGFHKYSHEVWDPQIQIAELDGQDDGDNWDDPDGDGVPNWLEGVSPIPTILILSTDPNDPDTYNLDSVFGPGSGYEIYGDEELRCRAIEIDIRAATLYVGAITINRAADWSYPGRNSVPPYPAAFAPTPALWWTPWP